MDLFQLTTIKNQKNQKYLELAQQSIGIDVKWLQPFTVEDPFNNDMRLQGFLNCIILSAKMANFISRQLKKFISTKNSMGPMCLPIATSMLMEIST